MKTIPIDDHCSVLNEIYTIAAADRFDGQKRNLLNRIERALSDAGHIEEHKPKWRDYIPSFFDWRKDDANPKGVQREIDSYTPL